MITTIPLLPLLLGWALAGASPGPATLAISGTAMAHGRTSGLIIAAGIVAGSASWGIAAALGVSALMLANAWVFEIIRYAGAAYLGYLALKSLRRASKSTGPGPNAGPPMGQNRLFAKGALLHLTNPKAILAWGSIFSIALPPGANPADIWQLFALLIATSACVFLGYGVLFSTPTIARTYRKLHRLFDAAFGLFFGAVAVKILTADLPR